MEQTPRDQQFFEIIFDEKSIHHFILYSEKQKRKHFDSRHPLHRTISDYNIVQKIGSGSFGSAYIANDLKVNMPNICVVKQMKYTSVQEILLFNTEINTLRKLRHPYIVSYYNMFVENNFMYIVMEYCNSQDLYTWITDNYNSGKIVWPLNIALVKEWMIALFSAMAFTHQQDIIHRDIKPANIFLSCDNHGKTIPKIGDFGLSYHLEKKSCASQIGGTPLYWAPEVIAGENPTKASDVYAMGCVLFELCTAKAANELVLGNTRFNVMTEIAKHYDKSVCFCILKMTSLDPKKRLSFEELSVAVTKVY
ncbi:MAG TPA: serine/threonine-protein kinase [Nitrosarchaeum sp.]|nr:serine/threonine-protein kinase [Nitrosarchaeum sp.]